MPTAPDTRTGQPPLAIVAGAGLLPRLIAEDCALRKRPYHVVQFDGISLDWTADHPVMRAVFEKPGGLFRDLRHRGVKVITFAGGMRRPTVSPLRFDLTGIRLAPKLFAALRGGDDAALRIVTEIFEAEGLKIAAAHELLEGLLAPAGTLTKAEPGAADQSDIDRAAEIARALGSIDVGQGAVVAQGICLGLESIQGTDAMLDMVAETGAPFRPDPKGAGGVLFKGPKPGQDWRMDLPAIGPETVRRAAKAGLAGIAVQAGGVLLLGRDEIIAEADKLNLFVTGHKP